ncbi:MAG: hypothetical protein K6B72_06515 [Lachnospiraceae bacterium]|jgi:hypothetical protein|nr:hypothetical protein [Lachnospiraceae bacterium]
MSSILRSDSIYDNEVPFCRVYGTERKKALEKLFLQERISYYIVWEQEHWWQKLLSTRRRDVCTFRINKADVPRAKELVAEMKGVRVRSDKHT